MPPLDVEQYRALVEHGPTMVWRAGTDARRDYFNAAWLSFTGRPLKEEVDEGWTEGIHPDDLKTVLANQHDLFERREPLEMEYRLRRFDGVYRYVSDRGVSYSDPKDDSSGFIGNCIDIHDLSTRERSSGAHDFFESSLDNACLAGFDGYFKRLNPSWTRTLGWTAEELMSRPSVEFVRPDDRKALLAGRERLQGGLPLGHLTNRYLCKDGTYRWLEWRSAAHVDRGMVYATARDITEQKVTEERLREAKALQDKLERQLIFADRMASVGTLAAGVAHEINNPLACMMANISLMIEELRAANAQSPSRPSTEMSEMATDIQEGAERIRKIVRGLKTFSRAEEEHRAVIDVRPLLDVSIDMTFNEIRQRARLVKDYGEVPLVLADDARLGQVFINLLINAAQAIQGDSTANEIRIMTSTDAAGRAVIEVRDTGVGIPASTIDRIFDPFFTSKLAGVGTGLGLWICHNIVTGIGGEITVLSTEGRGATFRVVLPAAAILRQESIASPCPAGKAVARAAVLVVDDEPSIGAVLRRILRDHEVTVVTRAQQALELLGSGKHFDVILSDLMMPDMSGMDFFDELEQRFPNDAPRVTFISGGAFTPAANAFLDRVGNGVIEKPFDAQGVRDIVERTVS